MWKDAVVAMSSSSSSWAEAVEEAMEVEEDESCMAAWELGWDASSSSRRRRAVSRSMRARTRASKASLL